MKEDKWKDFLNPVHDVMELFEMLPCSGSKYYFLKKVFQEEEIILFLNNYNDNYLKSISIMYPEIPSSYDIIKKNRYYSIIKVLDRRNKHGK